MSLIRIALLLAQERAPEWLDWSKTWQPAPVQASLVEAELVDNQLRCRWTTSSGVAYCEWSARTLLETIGQSPPEIAGPLLWRLARAAAAPGELDAVMQAWVSKQTGLTPEPVPFVRKGQTVASRMAAEVASVSPVTLDPLVKTALTVTVDQHGTLIQLQLNHPLIRGLLDRFLRRVL